MFSVISVKLDLLPADTRIMTIDSYVDGQNAIALFLAFTKFDANVIRSQNVF